MDDVTSWGQYPKIKQKVKPVIWRSDVQLPDNGTSAIAYGQGRSYGDVCLNEDGVVLDTGALNRIISFDRENGVLECEAGMTLEQILKVIVPAGWFLPVSPGTKFVSIGGAIANDIHGKNHHSAGTFGRYVQSIELLRSDQGKVQCSKRTNSELFKATIAGLGLTGLILSAKIQLIKISSPLIDMESIKFDSLAEFFRISEASAKNFDYTVAWLDCLSGGDQFGRGIFMRGNHAENDPDELRAESSRKSLKVAVPFTFPSFMLNRFTMRCFNEVYYQRQFAKFVKSKVHYDPFFYPLDAVLHWNRIYGSEGFLQFQCVIPPKERLHALPDLLGKVVDSGKASFLAVLKEFGSITSPGMLSFPRPGVTLCMDFAYRGKETLELMGQLEEIVRSSGGALYPAKDACMSADSFKQFYPNWAEFKQYCDPQCSSSFWRRVTGE